MRMGLGLGVGLVKSVAGLAFIIGLAWAGLTSPTGVVAAPSLKFGAAPADAVGVLRFETAATLANRRNAAGSANQNVLVLGAANAITLGDPAAGTVTVQGSRLSLTIGSTELASVDTSGLTIAAMTVGRVVTVGTGGLLVDTAGLSNAHVAAGAAIAGSKISPNFGAQAIVTTGAGTVASLRVTGLGAGIGHYDGSGNLTSSTIVDADVAAGAAIAGSKVSPSFGAQAVITTSSVSCGAAGPASTGYLRLAGNNSASIGATGIRFRNAANSADSVNAIWTDSGDFLRVTSTNAQIQAGSYMQLLSPTIFVGDSAGTTACTFTNVPSGACSLGWASTATSVTINQATVSTNGVTGKKLTVAAQTASGTTSTGGELSLEAGGGTSADGLVTAKCGTTTTAQLSSAIADTETALLVRRNVGGAFSLQRVSMGAADSGGSGFKVLRVAN